MLRLQSAYLTAISCACNARNRPALYKGRRENNTVFVKGEVPEVKKIKKMVVWKQREKALEETGGPYMPEN